MADFAAHDPLGADVVSTSKLALQYAHQIIEQGTSIENLIGVDNIPVSLLSHSTLLTTESLEGDQGYTAESFAVNLKLAGQWVGSIFDRKQKLVDIPELYPGFLSAYVVDERKISKAIRTASNVGYSQYSDTMVSTPIQLRDNIRIVRYADALHEAFLKVEGFYGRILQPLLQWTGSVLEDDQNFDKNWIKAIKPVNIEEIQRLLQPVYEPGNDGVKSERPLPDAYTTLTDVAETGRLITMMVNHANKFLELEPRKVADEIVENMSKIQRLNEEKDVFSRIPKGTMKSLYNILYAGAREMEVIATLIFQVHTLAVAYQETIETLIKKPK